MQRIVFFFARKYSSETILNPLNIQILGKSLNQKVFPSSSSSNTTTNTNDRSPGSLNRIQMQTLELARSHLDSHSIPWNKERPLLPEISGDSIPSLLEDNLSDHFKRMATELTGEYFKLALQFGDHITRNLKANNSFSIKTPPFNSQAMADIVGDARNGWFKWNSETGEWARNVDQDGPEDKVILLDVETCPQISLFPVLACAYGQSGWYFWLPPQDGIASDDTDRLIPLKHARLVIGHHVAFDRARIRDEYETGGGGGLYQTERKFLDTLSMHCAVAGLSSQQRGLWQERKKRKSLDLQAYNEEEEDTEDLGTEDTTEQKSTEKWGSRSSLNNLSDSLQLHCNRKLDKSVRDSLLLKATHIDQISGARNEILEYCARDVEATAQLFSVLFPKFLKKSPHPVTFAALLEMGSFVLPLVKDEWTQYIEDCDKMYNEATEAIELELSKAVEETCMRGLECKNYCFVSSFSFLICRLGRDFEGSLVESIGLDR